MEAEQQSVYSAILKFHMVAYFYTQINYLNPVKRSELKTENASILSYVAKTNVGYM